MREIIYNKELNIKYFDNDRISDSIKKTGKLTHILEDCWGKDYIEEHLYPGAVVLDVGAYIGDSTRFFLDRGCIVYAFEPNFEPFLCLQYNCPQAISLFRPLGKSGQKVYSVWSDIGSTKLNGQAYHVEDNKRSDDCDIPQIELSLCDFMHLEKCDLLKLDAEGSEYRILDNGRPFIEKYKPFLMTEVHKRQMDRQGVTIQDYIELLAELNYERVGKKGVDVFYKHLGKK